MTRKQMQIGAIYLDKNSGKPLVVLHDPEGKLIMPIWVGMSEVRAISLAASKEAANNGVAGDELSGTESSGVGEPNDDVTSEISSGESSGLAVPRPRPSVYEVFLSAVETMGGRVREVSIEANKEDVFTAWVSLEPAFDPVPMENIIERIEARPADAVVLASISGAPLFVSSDLFDQAEVKAQAPMDEKEAEKFKEFLKDLKPSDFAKYIGKEPEQDSN